MKVNSANASKFYPKFYTRGYIRQQTFTNQQEELSICEQEQNQEGKLMCLLHLGSCHDPRIYPDEGMSYLQDAFQLAQQQNNNEAQAWALYYMMIIRPASQEQNMSRAFELLNEENSLLTNQGIGLKACLHALEAKYYSYMDYEQVDASMEKAEETYPRIQDVYIQAFVSYNIAKIHQDHLDNRRKAMRWAECADNYSSEIGDWVLQRLIFELYERQYQCMYEFRKQCIYALKIFQILLENDPKEAGSQCYYLHCFYSNHEEKDNAKIYLDKAAELVETYGTYDWNLREDLQIAQYDTSDDSFQLNLVENLILPDGP